MIAFKVGNDPESIVNAGQRFLSDQDQMSVLTGRIFAGHLRSIVGSMTVEEIVREAAGGLANANINVLNGADGLGQIAAGLVGQGLTIFDSIKQNLTDGDVEWPPDEPAANTDRRRRAGRPRERGVTEDAKTPADQVEEIAKLVQDAQDKLDQVARALRTLQQRLSREDRPEP